MIRMDPNDDAEVHHHVSYQMSVDNFWINRACSENGGNDVRKRPVPSFSPDSGFLDWIVSTKGGSFTIGDVLSCYYLSALYFLKAGCLIGIPAFSVVRDNGANLSNKQSDCGIQRLTYDQ
jgi:hypothetical protein